MASANRILESVCNLPLTVTEARELFRRGVSMANALKQATTIANAITFARAETTRIALQGALTQLSGDELSRLRGTVIASTVMTNAAQFCALGSALWLLAADFEGDKLIEARDNYAEQTQKIKAAHTPTQIVVQPNIQPILVDATPVGSDSNTGLMIAAGGAAVGLLGFLLWANNRA
jgi:hypothetical protein